VGDLITAAHAIIKAHKATEHCELRRTALTRVDGYSRVYGKQFTNTELRALKEECFRIEAARLGMSQSDISNHWRAIADIEHLSERVLWEREAPISFSDNISALLVRRRPRVPRSGRVKRAVRRFQRLSRRDVTALIRAADLNRARELLNTPKPTADSFSTAVWKLSNHNVVLASWKLTVEKCYQRLSEQDREDVRSELLGFYWLLRDYHALEAFLPAKPRLWVEAPQEMETYLKLSRIPKAKALVAFCESKLHPKKRFRYELPLRLALTQYYSSLGDYDAALKQIVEMDTVNLWAYENYPSLVSIKTMEALLIAMKARKRMLKSENVAILNGDPSLLQTRRHLERMIAHLRAVFLSHKRWNWRCGCIPGDLL
jgi:hypothetical protein